MAVRAVRTGRGAGGPRQPRAGGGGGAPYPRFALFAECLLTGVWLLLAALPLVTLLPAFAAACAHLRRHLAGGRGGLREFTADLRRAVRTGLRLSLGWWAGLALLAFDLRVAASGVLPGGPVMLVAGAAATVLWVVTGLRAAATIPAAPEPGGHPAARTPPGRSGPSDRSVPSGGAPVPGAGRSPLREALRRTAVADPGGSALLAGGLAVVAVAAWQLLPLAAPALGCLAACAVAVEHRYEERRRAAAAPLPSGAGVP
ncbi:hypothetical protein [Streptomyces lycii]|uniref:hypothetical protein n=1 Tax=Streptomyces lycii TaxID=2654337 RepID=UPI001F405FFD|nr:hypothetical protein [Streptomyces lycii]